MKGTAADVAEASEPRPYRALEASVRSPDLTQSRVESLQSIKLRDTMI